MRAVSTLPLLLALVLAGSFSPSVLAAHAQADPLAEAKAFRHKVLTQEFLQFFGISVEAPPEWMVEVEAQGAHFTSNAMYISGSAKEGSVGDDQYYFKYHALENHILAAQKANQVAWMTYYVLAQSAPALYKPNPSAAARTNAKVPGTMRSYWEIYKRCLQICAQHPDVPMVMHIEPDPWGDLLQSCKCDVTATGIVMVGGSGMPELAGMPDSMVGWADAFRLLRDKYAPRVLLCADPPAWDGGNSMSGANWVKYFTAMHVTPAGGWDLFVAQQHDWDQGLRSNGANAHWPPYTEKQLVGYQGSWKGLCSWIRTIHEGTGMWCAMWQLPVGNATYATCDGSPGHGCDGYAEALLDTYPKDGLVQAMAASGCCLWIFSHGGDGASVWDARKDGITNPPPIPGNKGKKALYADDDGGYMRLHAIAYWKHPWPILGKPKKEREAVAAKPAQTAQLTDKSALATYDHQLEERIGAELATHRLIHITSSMLHAGMRIDALSAHQMSLTTDDGGSMSLPWSSLSLSDRLQLALLQERDNNPADHALVAFFLLANGEVTKAEDKLREATGFDGPVRSAFTIK